MNDTFNNRPTYSELLEYEEWKEKRKSILDRDKHFCQICGNTTCYKHRYTNNWVYFNSSVSNSFSKTCIGSFTIPDYKKKFGIESISILQHPSGYLYGVDNIKVLYGVDQSLTTMLDQDSCSIEFVISHISSRYLPRIHSSEISSKTYEPLFILSDAWNMHVHHKKYIHRNLPWDYDDTDLISLCSRCHFTLHQREEIPVYDNYGNRLSTKHCSKCSGTGYLPEYHYYKGGVCFDCHGNRYQVLA